MFAHLRAVAKAYRRALGFADRYRRLQALLFLFMLVDLPVSTSIPLISKYIVDQAILGGNLVLFVNFTIICVAYYVINALVDVGYSLLHNNLNMRYARDFQFHLLRGVMAGSYERLKASNSGELLTKLMEDAGTVTQSTAMFVPGLVIQLVRTLVLVYLCFCFSAEFTALCFAAVPAYYFVSHWFGRRQGEVFRGIRESVQGMYCTVAKMSEQMRSIKANRCEPHVLRRFRNDYYKYLNCQILSGIVGYASKNINNVLIGGFIFSVTCYFIIGVIRGQYSLGFFVAYSMYLRLLVSDLSSYSSLYQGILASYPAFDRTFSLVGDAGEGLTRPAGSGDGGFDIELDAVSYSIGSRRILDNVNHRIREGECVLVAGPNGAGKTMLVNLLSGIIKPDSGRVLLGGADMAAIPRPELRSLLSVVYCNSHFDHAYFKACPTSAEPALLAGLGSRAEAPSYTQKSTGEQYIQAFLFGLSRNPRVLILDEPFANLDPQHCEVLLEMLQSVKGRMTVIITCHEPSKGRALADSVLDLSDHQLVEMEGALA